MFGAHTLHGALQVEESNTAAMEQLRGELAASEEAVQRLRQELAAREEGEAASSLLQVPPCPLPPSICFPPPPEPPNPPTSTSPLWHAKPPGLPATTGQDRVGPVVARQGRSG